MSTAGQIDLETEIREFSTDDVLMGFLRNSGFFLTISKELEKLHEGLDNSLSIYFVYPSLINILKSQTISKKIALKLTENIDDKNIIRKFSLTIFYYLFKSHIEKIEETDIISLNFPNLKQIFNFFFEQNPNELEKLIRHAIDNRVFDFIPSILRVFSETGNIPILVLGINQFLEAFNKNGFELLDQSLDAMQNLKTSLDKLVDHETYAETLEKLNSFLAQQIQLRPEVSPTANLGSFSLQQMQLSVDQTQVVHEQPNFLRDTENQSWIKRHELEVALGVALFGVALALVIPAALIFAGVIASTPTIGFVLIGVAAAASLVALIVYAIIKYRNSKELEKPTAIIDYDQPGIVQIN